MTRVKICGITNEADLEMAVAAGADAIGIICGVSVDTPREVSIDRARELTAAVPPFVSTVLVTMPDDPEHALELAETIDSDALQCHGGLSRDALSSLSDQLEAKLVLALDADEADTAAADGTLVDALLVDTPGTDGGGGTGRTHDWDQTRAATRDLESPVILAGGLTPDNVEPAVQTVEPFAVDVASGVEKTGGVKDHGAVRSFIERAKTVAHSPTP